jgi:hypothetical protein
MDLPLAALCLLAISWSAATSASTIFQDGFDRGIEWAVTPGIDLFGQENLGSVTLYVHRPGFGAASVTIDPGTGSATFPSDFTLSTTRVEWAAGDIADKPVTIILSDDNQSEDDEVARLLLVDPTGGGLGARTEIEFTIQDNDLGSTSHLIGESIPIPFVSESAGYGIGMAATNAGLYFQVFREDDSDWIYRYNPGSRTWTFVQRFVHGYHPATPKNEAPAAFSLNYWDLGGFGTLNRNNGFPDILVAAQAGITTQDMDYSGSWWLARNTGLGVPLILIDNSGDGQFGNPPQVDVEFYLPTEIDYLTPDPDGVATWGVLEFGHLLYRMSPSGTFQTFDLGSYAGSDFENIKKLRFSNGAAYVLLNNYIFRISTTGTMTLFHTIPDRGVMNGSNFAVDGSHLFTSNGDVVSLATGQVVANILKSMPDPAVVGVDATFDYLMQLGHFQAGEIEMLDWPTSTTLYVLYQHRILAVPKKLYPGQY